MKAGEFLKKEEVRDVIVFQSTQKRIWLSDLMEAYANQKVLEALEEEVPKACLKQIPPKDVAESKWYYKTQVLPKYKL